MRWLFLLALLLNLAYIAWEMSKPSADHIDVPAIKNVPPVILLSELRQQPSQMASLSADNDEAQRNDGAESGPVEQLPVEDSELSKPVAAEEMAADKVADAVNGGAVKSAKVEPVPVEQEKLPVADSKKADTPVAGQPDSRPGKAVQVASCYTLGPFRDLDNLRGLTREIKSYVVKADFRGREEKEQTLYWVYLKPEPSRKKAIETGNRLKAKKIKDFYVIRDGEKQNGLSLGHFRNRDGAYGLAQKVQKLGFDVLVEPVFRSYTVYWLDYQLSSGVSIPESIFEKYIKTAKKDKISRLARDCGS